MEEMENLNGKHGGDGQKVSGEQAVNAGSEEQSSSSAQSSSGARAFRIEVFDYQETNVAEQQSSSIQEPSSGPQAFGTEAFSYQEASPTDQAGVTQEMYGSHFEIRGQGHCDTHLTEGDQETTSSDHATGVQETRTTQNDEEDEEDEDPASLFDSVRAYGSTHSYENYPPAASPSCRMAASFAAPPGSKSLPPTPAVPHSPSMSSMKRVPSAPNGGRHHVDVHALDGNPSITFPLPPKPKGRYSQIIGK